MARMKFLCDAERCIECNSCTVACKNENDVPWGVNRRRVVVLNDGEPGEKSISVACMHCTDAPCAAVCPVDCFYEGANMLVIHPTECIVCGICVPECPEEAIVYADDPEGLPWKDLNAEYADKWPNISSAVEPPTDADKFQNTPGKFEKYFDPAPGAGT